MTFFKLVDIWHKVLQSTEANQTNNKRWVWRKLEDDFKLKGFHIQFFVSYNILTEHQTELSLYISILVIHCSC